MELLPSSSGGVPVFTDVCSSHLNPALSVTLLCQVVHNRAKNQGRCSASLAYHTTLETIAVPVLLVSLSLLLGYQWRGGFLLPHFLLSFLLKDNGVCHYDVFNSFHLILCPVNVDCHYFSYKFTFHLFHWFLVNISHLSHRLSKVCLIFFWKTLLSPFHLYFIHASLLWNKISTV